MFCINHPSNYKVFWQLAEKIARIDQNNSRESSEYSNNNNNNTRQQQHQHQHQQQQQQQRNLYHLKLDTV